VKSDLAAGGISWAYDAIGNITKKDNTLGDARLHAEFIRYGENGAGPYAMTSADERVFQYDLNGNLVHMPGQTLEFDAENRLTRVTKDDGSKTEMIYGHDGERKIKRVTKPDGSVGEVLYIDPNFEVRDGKRYKYIWADKQRIARVALE
jgi:YD repeat-containing protein